METEKLYYADPFLTDFTATVLDCQPDKNGYLVTLDRTAFYPEGGGQPADHGVLDRAAVTDVHEKNGVILHNVDRAVEIGKTVAGAIDWGRRFDHMQQHSGEHICSGLICERFHCDNVGFHMGADIVTIDFNADISWEELLEIEAKANQYLYENHSIDIQFYRGAELEAIEAAQKKAALPALEIEPLTEEKVDFDTFCRSDFRVVKVKACEAVKKSDKLLRFTLDDGTGTDRQILSGIHKWYKPEELVGKTLVAIVNLPPRKMMGLESCGMLLSAVHTEKGEEVLNLIMVDDKIPAGAKLC